MPDRAMGWDPENPVDTLAKKVDPQLPYREDLLKQCGDRVPIGRGEPAYTDRSEIRELPPMEPSLESKMVAQEAVIQAVMSGETGSLACQADPDCHAPFSPPTDRPFGDPLAEERCDGPPPS